MQLSVSVVVQRGTMSGLADETRWMDATEQAALVSKGEVTPSELLEAAIERIERSNPALNAVVIAWFDHARSVAAEPDLPDGPFRGVPFLLKDLYTTYAGQTLSNGNVALKAAGIDRRRRHDARRPVQGGRAGHRRADEQPGDGQPADHRAGGLGGDPQPVGRSSARPVGRAAASAAAVAVGMVPFANASDGGGIDPHPGVVLRARRPEAEPGADHASGRRVPRSASASSCASAARCATRRRLLDAVRGPGVGDTVIAPAPDRPYVDEVGADPGRLRIGLLDVHPRGDFVHDGLRRRLRAAAVDAGGARPPRRAGVARRASPTPRCPSKFTALWATQMAMAARRIQRDARAPADGRTNRAGELGARRAGASGSPPSTTPRRRRPGAPSAGRCSSGGPTAGTCCSRRRWASRRRR